MSTSTKSCPTIGTDMTGIHPMHSVMHRTKPCSADTHGLKPKRDVILSASDKDARRISTEPICNHMRLSGHLSASDSMQVPARPQNPPCQTHTPMVHYLPGTPVAASVASRRPHSALKKCTKIAQFLCNVSPLEATLMDLLASVANKRLTTWLNPLEATLTKNIGGWGYPVWLPCIHFRVR